ncbi:hypothetical protein M3Y97_00401400 [Aphelenchoides bicaudatus]|nr:hypothetical protein M3Y97_00401400 [Aphelenchoides bicaudatus]
MKKKPRNPLHFNPPKYRTVSFPGFYGIQRSSSWLSIYQNRKLKEFVDVTPSEMTVIKLWNDFQATVRTVLLPHQIYGASVIFVCEKRKHLLEPAIYLQFIAHLSNLKHSGNLRTAELYDIIARLQQGPSYDPRKDVKSYVYSALKKLEKQRQAQLENAKQTDVAKKLRISSRSRASSPSRLESSLSVGSSRNVSNSKSRKRTGNDSMESSIGASNSKRARTQQSSASSPMTAISVEVEKKRQFNTQTPMELLLSTTILKPEQVPISCFDDLACRYQFSNERHLKTIWRFCRNWVRKSLE